MKVFLGGTVNGSTWRDYVIAKLSIDYFNPVVTDWNETALERELYERRHCHYCLYVITPKMEGFYALAEVTDDSFKRPDRTIYCFLKEDGGSEFTPAQRRALEVLGRRVEKNGAIWLKSLDEVIAFLNAGRPKEDTGTIFPALPQLNAFICYGRKHSREVAKNLQAYLETNGMTAWYDSGEVPLEIRFLSEVNVVIEKASNFIFIISPHSVRSEYCRRELEYALKLGKRVIAVMHLHPDEAWETLPEEIKKLNVVYFKKSDRAAAVTGREIADIIIAHHSYVEHHTKLLLRSLLWQNHACDPRFLLYGRERKEAIYWTRIKFENTAPPCRVTSLQKQYIEESEKLQTAKQAAFWLQKRTSFITENKYFDSIIGFVSLANPISLLPQLYVLVLATQVAGISVGMWIIFVFLQLSFSLVGIKQKNMGMFISMFTSMLISLSIIIIVMLKS